MSKKNILLVGAGQLGSRHLQALATLNHPANMIVVDPFQASLDTSKKRVAEVAGHDRHEYDFRRELGELPSVDFAVIATSADVRRRVIEELLAKTSVRYLLLEKVLFQSAKDCREVGVLLEQAGTKAWVNAPRRMWACYKKLKAGFGDEPIQSFVQSGSGWGLACNGYHMLDLFAWLDGSPLQWLSSKGISHEPVPSKRAGFYELKGTLSGQFESGAHITISDHAGESKDSFMLLETPSRVLHISEKTRKISLVTGEPIPSGLQGLELVPEFQSGLTDKVALQLFSHGDCELATYSEASDIHQKMLPAFADCFTGIEKEEGICPIT